MLLQWAVWAFVMGAILSAAGAVLMLAGLPIDRFSTSVAGAGVALLAMAAMMLSAIHAFA